MTQCPYQKEAFTWGDKEPPCLVRYADHSVSGILDLPPVLVEYVGNLTDLVKSNLTEFHQTWVSLMDGLVKEVSMGSSSLKFETKEAKFNTFQKIYALMQCTPDLSLGDCDVCLRQSVTESQACCLRTIGGNVQRANCYFGRALNPFYSPHTDASPSVSTTRPQINNKVDNYNGKNDKGFSIVNAIVVAAVAVMISIISISVLIFNVKKSRQEIECKCKEIENTDSLQFDIGTIKFATDNFSDANKLRQGGFGAVYEGTLHNGQQIAVKRLSMNSKQGEEEFKNEVILVARLQDRNLVWLLGFCLERKERILVYEFLPNSSFNRFIFDPIKHEQLNWEIRYKIIGDSRLRIFYRDLKASNILLDSNMNPKISDFGMARLFEMDHTHFSTNEVVGTLIDVFSFGVLLLEIVSGQKRSCFGTEEETRCLLTYAWKRWNEGTALNLTDSTLREGSRNEMMKCIHIGLLCVQESVYDRPTMASVIHMLNSNSVTLPAPSKPGFFMQSSYVLELSSSLSSYRY
ncbi:hypothetical protein ACOSQ3_012734 [Xanthoceras sorbifolium]